MVIYNSLPVLKFKQTVAKRGKKDQQEVKTISTENTQGKLLSLLSMKANVQFNTECSLLRQSFLRDKKKK